MIQNLQSVAGFWVCLGPVNIFPHVFVKKAGERSNLAGLLGVWVRAHCRNNGGSQSENGANQFFG